MTSASPNAPTTAAPTSSSTNPPPTTTDTNNELPQSSEPTLSVPAPPQQPTSPDSGPPPPSSPGLINPINPTVLNPNLPKNAQSIALLLKSFDLTDIQPCVIFQLQEFAHRYINDVLQDAVILSDHCSKPSVDAEDIKEAIQGRIHHSFAPPPSQDFVRDLAQRVNKTPLPVILDKTGVRLPQEKFCLTATSYQIVPDPSAMNLNLDTTPTKQQEQTRPDVGEESEEASEINDFTEVNDEDSAELEKTRVEPESVPSPQVKQEEQPEGTTNPNSGGGNKDSELKETKLEEDSEFMEVDDTVKEEPELI